MNKKRFILHIIMQVWNTTQSKVSTCKPPPFFACHSVHLCWIRKCWGFSFMIPHGGDYHLGTYPAKLLLLLFCFIFGRCKFNLQTLLSGFWAINVSNVEVIFPQVVNGIFRSGVSAMLEVVGRGSWTPVMPTHLLFGIQGGGRQQYNHWLNFLIGLD